MDGLPIELKVLIFKHLDFKDLSVLSITCKPIRDIIISHFLLSRDRLVNTFKEISKIGTTNDYMQMSSDLGLLIKRATFILPNFKRVELVIDMFHLVDLKSKLRTIYEIDKAAFKDLTKAIKCLLSRLIAGWKFKEVLKLIDEIEIYFDHFKLLMEAMTKPFGTIRNDEQYVRYFYRKVNFVQLKC